MSGPVDVLAVLKKVRQRLVPSLTDAEYDEIVDATSAVAELIDKVDSALALGWSDTAARELRAALARCGGAK